MANSSSQEYRLCPIDEIASGEAKVFLIEGGKVALFRQGDHFYALDDHCPHRSGPLSEGWVDDGQVTCPWHQWQFRLTDGHCTNLPGSAVKTFSVVLREGAVWISA